MARSGVAFFIVIVTILDEKFAADKKSNFGLKTPELEARVIDIGFAIIERASI